MQNRMRIVVFAPLLAVLAIAVAWFCLRPENAASVASRGNEQRADANGAGGAHPVAVASSLQTAPSGGSDKRAANGFSTWETERRQTEDYFALVSSAAQAAAEGDGEAALVIADALSDCTWALRLARMSSDPEVAFWQEQREFEMKYPRRPAWVKERDVKRFGRCARLAKENPFGALAQGRADYYSSLYWIDEAIRLGSSSARADKLSLILNASAAGSVSDDKGAQLESAEDFVRDIVRSDDPYAIFKLGNVLESSAYSSDPYRGVVLMLAACDMGLDCSGQHLLVGQARCDFVEECGPSVDYRELITKGRSPSEYAKLYARAQDVVDLHSRGDWDGLDSYIRIDGSIRKRFRDRVSR